MVIPLSAWAVVVNLTNSTIGLCGTPHTKGGFQGGPELIQSLQIHHRCLLTTKNRKGNVLLKEIFRQNSKQVNNPSYKATIYPKNIQVPQFISTVHGALATMLKQFVVSESYPGAHRLFDRLVLLECSHKAHM